MYYNRSHSPASFSDNRGLSSYSRGLNLNDLGISSFTPRNRSVQRVINTDFGRRERSRSPPWDRPGSRAAASRPLPAAISSDISPILRRKELALPSHSLSDSRGQTSSWVGADDYSYTKPKTYYDLPCSSPRYNSFSTTGIKRPQRTDYSDYLRPALQSRPMLKTDYVPRSRTERESAAIPLVRERKLIKFREITNDILTKVRRRISWDLNEDTDSSPLNDIKKIDGLVSGNIISDKSRDNSLNRLGLGESHSRTPESRTPTCNSRRSSDQSIDRMSPRNLLRLKSPRNSTDINMENGDSQHIPIPPPRKKSIGSTSRGRKSRKSSFESMHIDEKSLNHSLIADKILRSRQSPDTCKVTEEVSDTLNINTSQEVSSDNFINEQIDTKPSPEISNDLLNNTTSESNIERGRRRRRRDIPIPPDNNEQSNETNTRCRNRIRHQLENTTDPAQLPSNVPHPTNRMHRKSVKYKIDSSNLNLLKNSEELSSKSCLTSGETTEMSLKENNSITKDSQPFTKKRKSTDNNILLEKLEHMKHNTDSSQVESKFVKDSKSKNVDEKSKISNKTSSFSNNTAPSFKNSIAVSKVKGQTKNISEQDQKTNSITPNLLKDEVKNDSGIGQSKVREKMAENIINKQQNSTGTVEDNFKISKEKISANLSEDTQKKSKPFDVPVPKKQIANNTSNNLKTVSDSLSSLKSNAVNLISMESKETKLMQNKNKIDTKPIECLTVQNLEETTIPDKMTNHDKHGLNVKDKEILVSSVPDSLKTNKQKSFLGDNKEFQKNKNNISMEKNVSDKTDEKCTSVPPATSDNIMLKKDKLKYPASKSEIKVGNQIKDTDKCGSINLEVNSNSSTLIAKQSNNIKSSNNRLCNESVNTNLISNTNESKINTTIDKTRSITETQNIVTSKSDIKNSNVEDNAVIQIQADQVKCSKINDNSSSKNNTFSVISKNEKTITKSLSKNLNENDDQILSMKSNNLSGLKSNKTNIEVSKNSLTNDTKDIDKCNNKTVPILINKDKKERDKNSTSTNSNDSELKNKVTKEKFIKSIPEIKPTILLTNTNKEENEIVVVCKLPQPKPKATDIKSCSKLNDIKESNKLNSIKPLHTSSDDVKVDKKIDQSLKIEPSVQLTIPNKSFPLKNEPLSKESHTFDSQKINSKSLKSDLDPGLEVNVTHVVVLKPKTQIAKTSSKMVNASDTHSSVAPLKSIPDIVQSTIKIRNDCKLDTSFTKDSSVLLESLIKDTSPQQKNNENQSRNLELSCNKTALAEPINRIPDVVVHSHKVEEKLSDKIKSSNANKVSDVHSNKLSSSNKTLTKIEKCDEISKVKTSIQENKNISDLPKTGNSQKYLVRRVKTTENINLKSEKSEESVNLDLDTKSHKNNTDVPKKRYRKSSTVPDVDVFAKQISNLELSKTVSETNDSASNALKNLKNKKLDNNKKAFEKSKMTSDESLKSENCKDFITSNLDDSTRKPICENSNRQLTQDSHKDSLDFENKNAVKSSEYKDTKHSHKITKLEEKPLLVMKQENKDGKQNLASGESTEISSTKLQNILPVITPEILDCKTKSNHLTDKFKTIEVLPQNICQSKNELLETNKELNILDKKTISNITSDKAPQDIKATTVTTSTSNNINKEDEIALKKPTEITVSNTLNKKAVSNITNDKGLQDTKSTTVTTSTSNSTNKDEIPLKTSTVTPVVSNKLNKKAVSNITNDKGLQDTKSTTVTTSTSNDINKDEITLKTRTEITVNNKLSKKAVSNATSDKVPQDTKLTTVTTSTSNNTNKDEIPLKTSIETPVVSNKLNKKAVSNITNDEVPQDTKSTTVTTSTSSNINKEDEIPLKTPTEIPAVTNKLNKETVSNITNEKVPQDIKSITITTSTSNSINKIPLKTPDKISLHEDRNNKQLEVLPDVKVLNLRNSKSSSATLNKNSWAQSVTESTDSLDKIPDKSTNTNISVANEIPNSLINHSFNMNGNSCAPKSYNRTNCAKEPIEECLEVKNKAIQGKYKSDHSKKIVQPLKTPVQKIKKGAKLPPPSPRPTRYGLVLAAPIYEYTSSSDDDSDSWDSDSSVSSLSDEDNKNSRDKQNESEKGCKRKNDSVEKKNGRKSSVSSVMSSATTTTLFSQSSVDDSPQKDSPSQATMKLNFRKYTIDDFVFLKLLGKGSFGKVLLAELKGHDMYFAIKCLKKDVVLEDDDVESTMIERRVLALGTQHPYMCKLYCTFQTKSYLFFVMEYLNGGDLMFHIEHGRFEERRAMFYGAEIVSALKFLHKRGIVYRDIKLDNILYDEDGHVHLVDFGMCKTGIFEYGKTSTFCGTPDYLPPEIILGQRYNQSVDWWSFGVLLFEMILGRSPFVGTDEDELFWSICNEEPSYPQFMSKEAKHLLENLLIKTPSKRIGMPSSPAGEIIDHPFFSSIDWDKLEKKEIPPPFKPTVSSACDTSNFDRSFTMDSPTLSPVDSAILQSMDQDQFQGFSYTNPHITG